jgi:hypothetical protein
VACTLDPLSSGDAGSLVTGDADINHQAAYFLCRCITGALRLGAGVAQTTVADSIIDRRGGVAVGGVGPDTAAQTLQLERVTVLGQIHCDILSASESLLDDIAIVEDQQAGCIRFSRYERGSELPRRYACVPSEETLATCSGAGRCVVPHFNSRRFGMADYAQLGAGCPPEILTASEAGAEVGAFAGLENSIRLQNLEIKLREFLPAGLVAVVIAET